MWCVLTGPVFRNKSGAHTDAARSHREFYPHCWNSATSPRALVRAESSLSCSIHTHGAMGFTVCVCVVVLELELRFARALLRTCAAVGFVKLLDACVRSVCVCAAFASGLVIAVAYITVPCTRLRSYLCMFVCQCLHATQARSRGQPVPSSERPRTHTLTCGTRTPYTETSYGKRKLSTRVFECVCVSVCARNPSGHRERTQ